MQQMRAKEYNTEFMQKQNTTLLKHFQNFLYRNFSKYEKKKKIYYQFQTNLHSYMQE